MKAENSGNRDCPQRDSAEHEGYAEVRRSFRSIWKERDSAQPELLEKILDRDNLNRASRRSAQSIRPALEKIKVYARGWLNYYGIADMKNLIEDINGWLYHRIRMCIWKQWKKPKTKLRNLLKLGVPEDLAYQAANSRRGYWFVTHTVAVNIALTKERLIRNGFYDLANTYQSVHVNY